MGVGTGSETTPATELAAVEPGTMEAVGSGEEATHSGTESVTAVDEVVSEDVEDDEMVKADVEIANAADGGASKGTEDEVVVERGIYEVVIPLGVWESEETTLAVLPEVAAAARTEATP